MLVKVMSGFAILVSAVALYFSAIRGIDVELAVSPYVYISNTLGGLPDMRIRFAIYANGPSTRFVPIRSSEVIVKSLESPDDGELTLSIPESVVSDSGFPIILQGGKGYSGDELFQHVEGMNDRVNRITRWFDKFSNSLPGEESTVTELDNFARNSLIPLAEYDGPEHLDMDSKIKGLLKKITGLPRQETRNVYLNELLYFRRGEYEIEFVVRGIDGRELASYKDVISVDAVLDEVLMSRFNENTLIIASSHLSRYGDG